MMLKEFSKDELLMASLKFYAVREVYEKQFLNELIQQ